MNLKKLVLIAVSSTLIACSHQPMLSSNTTLIPSNHPYALSRLSDSETAGPICPYHSFLFCIDYAHQTLLTQYPKIFQSTATALNIQLYNGNQKSYLVENLSTCHDYLDCQHKVIADYPSIHSVLIFQPKIGMPQFKLLNLNDGTELILENLPIFSPDFNYMLSYNSLPDPSTALKIYQFNSQYQAHLVFDGSQYLPQLAPQTLMNFPEVKWLDQQRFILQSQKISPEHSQQNDFFLVEHRPTASTTWHFTAISEEHYQQLQTD